MKHVLFLLSWELTLKQAKTLETGVPGASDDQMIVYGDAKLFGDCDHFLRHADIGLRGGGVARGVVVHEAITTR